MVGETFAEFVLDQLKGLPGVESRRMFGGVGLYANGQFFAIVFSGRLYFKTDDCTRPGYVALGMSPFQPSAKQTLKSYYEVPSSVLEDRQALVDWARAALSC